MPAEAALPLIGKIAPILTTLSSADAPAVAASVKAAADTRPKTVFSLIPFLSPERRSLKPARRTAAACKRGRYSSLLWNQHYMADPERQVARLGHRAE